MHDADSHPMPLATGSPPETIDDDPLTIDAASELMARLGFIAFRTPPAARMPDSCLMALLRDTPTFAHFDPEAVSYWSFEAGHGGLATIEVTTRPPLSHPFSWGRIRISDRLGMRNSFVTFGGQLTAEAMGPGALLVIFRSPVPILRLPGHSQRADHLAEEAIAFFGRLLPRLWDSTMEQLVGGAAPEALWAAFLLHERERGETPNRLFDEADRVKSRVWRGLRQLSVERPDALAGGRRMLHALGLSASPVMRR